MDQAEFDRIIASWKQEEIYWKEREEALTRALWGTWTTTCPDNDLQWSTEESIRVARKAIFDRCEAILHPIK